MKKELFKFKKDTYRKKRGDYSRFLNIYCESCGTHLFLYQKDGPGPLKRVYLDRILAPEDIREQQNLVCNKCKKIIGISAIFEKESRKAFTLFSYTFVKKVGKGIYPPEKLTLE